MNLQIKNVHFSERLSEETNAFACDVYFNGKKFAYAKNDGHGGETCINRQPNCEDIYKQAESYAKSLPNIVSKYKGKDGNFITWNSDLEGVVDSLLETWLDNKVLSTNSRKGIFYEKPNSIRAIISWKGYTIPKLLKSEHGRKIIVHRLEELKKQGCKILNNNLSSIQ
jgi:hypothetical protein